MTVYRDYRLSPARPDLAPLMRKVESLGVSCELGLIQRHCDVETIGLFRFGYAPFDGLIRALEEKFANVGSLDALGTFTADNLEYNSLHATYGFEFHSGHFADRISEAELLDKIAAHFRFLARKLMDKLGSGNRLFVYRPESPVPSRENALRLSDALGHFGQPVLLWVELTDDPAKFGTAEWTVPGRVITGYLDWFAKVNYAAAMPFDYWISMLQTAVELWEASPAKLDAELKLAKRARKAGKHERAFEILGGLFERFPDRAEPFVEAATSLNELKRQGDALALLEVGLARLPDNPALLLELSRTANAQSDRRFG